MRWLRWSIGTSMTESKREQAFRGLGVSGGVAIGPIYVLNEKTAAPPQLHDGGGRDARAFARRWRRPRGQLEALIASQDKLAGEILEFQLALLDDDDMLAPVFRAIEDGTPWDEAWSAMLDREIAEYRQSGGDTLAARADDLADLRDRVLRAPQGSAHPRRRIPPGAILVAADLTPSAFLGLDWEADRGRGDAGRQSGQPCFDPGARARHQFRRRTECGAGRFRARRDCDPRCGQGRADRASERPDACLGECADRRWSARSASRWKRCCRVRR